jgi:3-hydroxyisobutyrate dehydrogenase-like beta-hydroxyacid dehydrogenase
MKNGRQTVGFIGLGRMGNPIARRLKEQNIDIVVHDASAPAEQYFISMGVPAQSNAKAIADSSDIVIVCLPTPQIVQAVITGPDGVNEGRRARYVIDISTTGPKVTREMSGALAASGKILIDAPVTGGVAGAKSGNLTMILGGPADAIEAVQPVLTTIARNLVIAGPRSGDGQMLKVINNLLSFIALEATAEAMALGVKAGLNPETMLQTFNAGTGRNSATEEKFPRSVMPRTFDFGFTIRGEMKDIGLCLSEAEALEVPMPVGMCARQIWTIAMAEQADQDMTSIVKLFERWADVEVRSTEHKSADPCESAAVG